MPLRLVIAFVSLLGVLFIPACVSRGDGEKLVRKTPFGNVETVIQNSWHVDARAIASKSYNDGWGFHRLGVGDSIVVRIYRSDFLIGTFDGLSHQEIVFQLPAEVQPGQAIGLRPIPASRAARVEGEYDRVAPMRDGEITAFKFGNPLMGWMKVSKVSHVKIVSMDDDTVVIHLRLKADLDDAWNFDLDEQFSLKVGAPEERARGR
jgi:hypothetical protein